MSYRRAVLVGLALGIGSAAAQTQRPSPHPLSFPADAGAINVRAFGAKGDGRTDDTAALRAAIDASGPDTGIQWWHDRIVFLPAGTYLVSDTLVKRYADHRFASGMALQGEGPGRTIIRLADHSPGFQDPAAPRGIVMTTSKHLDTSNNRDYVGKGEGNDAYENFVEGLTIDAGEGNPGAVGIDYLANNLGAIRDVVVQAPGGSGAVGISMLRRFPGPALIQTTRVQGFRTGIAIDQGEYGMTFADVTLDGQAANGLVNNGNVVSADHLTISRSGEAGLINQAPGGLVTLVDSDVGGVLSNRGTVVFRDTRATLPGTDEATAAINGVLRDGQPLARTRRDWSVPRVSIATVDPGPARSWVGVTGSTEDKPVDATAALQRAFDSGASTIYLRHGTFWLSGTVNVPASVHRILGMSSTLRVFPTRQPDFTHEAPMLRVAGAGSTLEIDHLGMDNSNLGGQLGIEGRGTRPLLLRDILTSGVVMLDRTRSGGPAALEDTCCGTLHLAGPAPVTARQFNTEGGGERVVNVGAPLAIIGVKTEQEGTVVVTSAGGHTDLLGGLIFMVSAPSPNGPPMFITRDADLAATFAEEVLEPGHGYRVVLRAERDGQVRNVDADSLPPRGLGRMVGSLPTPPR